jgi:hypothetical protein
MHMKRITFISLSVILSLGIIVAGIIGINSKETVKLDTNAKFALYDFALSEEWKNPEPRDDSENPIGLDDTSAYWVNSNGCVMTRWVLQLDANTLPDNDFDATTAFALGKRPTVLNTINQDSLAKIKLADEDVYLEMLISPYDDSLGMYFSPEEYKIYQLARAYADTGEALLVFIGCPKETNIDPLSLTSEVVLAKAS